MSYLLRLLKTHRVIRLFYCARFGHSWRFESSLLPAFCRYCKALQGEE